VSLIQRIESNCRISPDRVILSDGNGEYTNSCVWELSGRVFAYLLQKGVGREDIVLVHLPRGGEAVMVMTGVFRAGAAVLVIEDCGPNDWTDSVIREVCPRITIDARTMDEIRRLAPAESYRIPELHDLAFIVYTTGTTGLSKGVMHEYGTLERSIETYEAIKDRYDVTNDRNALVTTLHSGVNFLTAMAAINSYVDIVPRGVFDDPSLFHSRLCEKRIQYTYLSPLYLQKYGPDVVDTPYMKYISVSFEPISTIYSGKLSIFNDYGMTEAGGAICEFLIDRAYDVTPIRKPCHGVVMSLLDENGRSVPDGKLGEICVETPYCRGYLNRPEETAEQFCGGLYHTRDLGKRLDDGNYIMYGRMNDALKTPRGLVIALEIEVEARKILGRPSAYVKIFPPDSDPTICLYTDFPIDFKEVQARMREIVPEYKLPTAHIQVEGFEYNNGKAIRVHLKNPRQ